MSSFAVQGLSAHELKPILRSHGWIHLCPARETARGCEYSLRLPSGRGTTISIEQCGAGVVCKTDTALSRTDVNSLQGIVKHMLSLDFPLKKFRKECKRMGDSELLRLSRCGWGRMFRSATIWEDAVKTLCTTNASWSHTQKMCASLCGQFGERTPSGHHAFPVPQRIFKAKPGPLAKRAGVGYRSDALHELANRFRQDGGMNLTDASPREAEEEVLSWKGFGPYAGRHLLVLLGHHCFLPVDREVASFLGTRSKGGRLPKGDVAHFSEWGDFRFTAYKLTRVARKLNWIGE